MPVKTFTVYNPKRSVSRQRRDHIRRFVREIEPSKIGRFERPGRLLRTMYVYGRIVIVIIISKTTARGAIIISRRIRRRAR